MSVAGHRFDASGTAPDRDGHKSSSRNPAAVSPVRSAGSRGSGGVGVVVAESATRQAATRSNDSAAGAAKTSERTYVLDTSVLLSDPKAIFRFAEHAVVIPVVVVSELEGKRNNPEIGYFARQALRNLDDLRVQHERLDFPIPVGDGGSLRVELNHSNMSVLPSGMQLGDNDSRILAVALNLSHDGLAVTVVSKDLPLRVKAASIGLAAEEYRHEQVVDSGWTGLADISLGSDQMAALYDDEWMRSEQAQGLPVNTGLVIH